MKTWVMGGGIKGAIPLGQLPSDFFSTSEQSLPLTLYEKVAWIFRGVNAITQGVASIPVEFYKGMKETDSAIEVEALPFRFLPVEIMDSFAGDMLIYGAAYGQVRKNSYGFERFDRYAPSSIQPYITPERGLEYFLRTAGGQYRFEPDQLFYCWSQNRGAELGAGVSAVMAAAAAGDVLRNLDTFAGNYFANGAINPTLISVSHSAKADFERLKSWYKRVLTGVKRAFNLEIIEGEVKATSIGFPVRELATTELTGSKREDIATALGVPQTLLWSNAANYATAQVDMLHFYQNTVIPLAEKLAAALNAQIFHPRQYHMALRPERLDVFQQAEVQKGAALVALQAQGILTIDEVRESLGYAPLAKEPPASEDNDALPADSGEANALQDELRKLATVAKRRIAEGKAAKIEGFTSEYIPPLLLSAIKAQLSEQTSADAVEPIINAAAGWADYA